MLGLKVGGVWKTGARSYLKVAGVWKEVALWTRVGGVWKQINSLLTASTQATRSGNRAGPGTCTSDVATATPVGGTAPYAYVWSFVSGDDIIINSPTAQSTTFSHDTIFPADDYFADFNCTVTDANGAIAVTNTCSVTLVQV